MPAFTYVASVIATSIGAWALGSFGLSVVTGAIATGLAYMTSRIINGNQNKGNNSANTQGGRIQVPPATNNKIPVVYGSAYVNGIITDARLITSDNANNDIMYYCLVLSEYTNNYTTPTYGLESVVWNDLRLTPVDSTTSAHKVQDGRKVVNGAIVTAGAFVTDTTYVITNIGTTDFTLIGAQTNNIGQVFTATGLGTGTGQAQEEDFKDESFIVDTNSLVELRVYAGGSAAANQIYPPQSSGNTVNAYNFWGRGSDTLNPNGDGSWTSANEMKGLVFAVVRMKYSDKGFTSLPNVTFQLANNIANPADVWYDYMTSVRYGAGIAAADLDTNALTTWRNFCAEDISYTGANLNPAGGAGTANQVLDRYQINGILDTSNQVKTNIDTILQNGGAWMSYNVATGLWSPVIKKAVSAGVPGETSTYFTASKSGTTLTVATFPNGRIEQGQSLYNSSGTLIGTISAQLAPTTGETAGQVGRYTISGASSTITTTTFYTVAPSLLSFNDDNIISGISISSTRLEDLYNKVEVEFYDKYNKDQKAYYRTSVASGELNPNEPANTLRMNLDLCNNSIQSDLIGQVELRQSRDDLVIEFTSTFYGIQTQAGDVIQVTSDLYGWAPKLFRVMRVKEQETEDGGLIAQIQALEYNPDAYTIEPITEFTTAANIGIGNLYSSVGLPPPENPIITLPNPGASVPNFTFNVDIPSTGGPFDEIEVYYTEGWDENLVDGKIIPGQVAVTGASGNGTTATLTFTAPSPSFTPYDVGQVVTIAGMTPAGYNGVKTITGATASTISFSSSTTGAMTVAGTITNAAGAEKGLMTVTAVTYNSINVGDYFDLGGVTVVSQLTQTAISTKTFASGGAPGAFTVTFNNVTDIRRGQILSAGTGIPSGGMVVGISGNEVTLDKAFLTQASGAGYQFTTAGGTGTYIVNTSLFASGQDYLYDQPLDTNFIFLKNKVPDGNATVFDSGSTVSILIVELPANSQTFRRYFLKSRLGNKKNFGAFSPNVPFDIDDNNSIPWQPNPTSAGRLVDLSDVSITTLAEGDILYYDATGTSPKWRNTPILSIDDDGDIGITVSSRKNNIFITETAVTNQPVAPLILRNSSSGTPAVGFGTTLSFETETPASGNKVSGFIDVQLTDGGVGTEDFTFGVGLMKNGVEPSYVAVRALTLDSGGNLITQGSITANSTYSAGMYNEAFQANGSIIIEGAATGGVKLAVDDAQTTTQTYILPTAYPAANGYVLSATTGGVLSWAGTGDVVGPASATDNALARFDLTTGKLIQNSSAILNDTGDLSIAGDLTVTGVDITTGADSSIIIVRDSSTTNTVLSPLTLRRTTSGTPAVGIGTALSFSTETAVGVNTTAGSINLASTNISSGNETFNMKINLRNAGVSTEVATLNSLGDLTITGDLTAGADVIVGSILKTSSSEDVANAAAISLTTAVSYFSTTTSETATLAAGSAGQFKSLMMVADGGDMVVTVTNAGWKTSGTGL